MLDGVFSENGGVSPYQSLIALQERHVRILSERRAQGLADPDFHARSQRTRLGHIFQEACSVALATSPIVAAWNSEVPIPFRKPRLRDYAAAERCWRLDLACLLETGDGLALEFTLDVQRCDAKTRREFQRRRHVAPNLLPHVWRPARNCRRVLFHTVSLETPSAGLAKSVSAVSVQALFERLEVSGLDIVWAAVRGYERKLAHFSRHGHDAPAIRAQPIT